MKILVVDDEPFNLKSMQVILCAAFKAMKLRLTDPKLVFDFASNGQEAVEKVGTSIQGEEFCYNLIVLDCQMPIKDGYQACREIRESFRANGHLQPYIVACTGNTEESQVQKTWES